MRVTSDNVSEGYCAGVVQSADLRKQVEAEEIFKIVSTLHKAA